MDLFDFSLKLPITDPTWIFLLVLLIILFAPILLNRLRIPHIIGMILAGLVIGEHGFNILARDSSFELFGKVGLYYIMFLAGLEMNMADFKQNRGKAVMLGLLAFIIPIMIGLVVNMTFLKYSLITSVLLASMYASHTLVAYPIVIRYGVSRHRSVSIAVGGTAVTDTLTLLVLAVVGGMFKGESGGLFWVWLVVKVVFLGGLIMYFFPRIGRWFFRRYDDNVMQFIFVLAMVFLGAGLMEFVGMEGILGAFLAGLVLNRLIPHVSPLMNHLEFVGNALFIPYFLIGVGMLINLRVIFGHGDALKVAAVMIVMALTGKWIACWLTQKIYRMSVLERNMMYGLSNAQAAATLAAVMVGYNVILGETPAGEPIRLLNESVLNGTILMILVTCTMASFSAQKGAHNIAMNDVSEEKEGTGEHQERILIPVSYEKNVTELVNLSTAIKSKKNKNGLFALNVINNQASDDKAFKQSKKVLNMAVTTASATDNVLQDLLRYDLNVANAIISVIKEQGITDLVLGLHQGKGVVSSFLGNMTEAILGQSNVTTLIYRPIQPIATVKRHLVVVPARAEKEVGFPMWVNKVWNIIHNSGAKAVFYASEDTMVYLKEMYKKRPIEAEFSSFDDWDDFLIMSREIKSDDTLWVVMSRRERLSYHANMSRIPNYLNKYFQSNSFVLVYPIQAGETNNRYLV